MGLLKIFSEMDTLDIIIVVGIIFIVIFLICLSSSLMKKNKVLREELKNKQNIDNIIMDEDIINDKKIENYEDINIIKEDKPEEDNIVVPNEKVDILNELNENLYEEDIKHLYSKEEIERILERFKDNSPFTCAFLTSCFTGTRTGEVFALTCNDIDFENGIINIKHNVYDKVDDGRGRWYMGTTKTFKAKRKIYMSETLCNALINFKKRQDYIKKISGLNYNYYHIEDVVNEYDKKSEQRIVKSSLSDINSRKN